MINCLHWAAPPHWSTPIYSCTRLCLPDLQILPASGGNFLPRIGPRLTFFNGEPCKRSYFSTWPTNKRKRADQSQLRRIQRSHMAHRCSSRPWLTRLQSTRIFRDSKHDLITLLFYVTADSSMMTSVQREQQNTNITCYLRKNMSRLS